MKRFRSNVRGQFVIVAALLISLLTLSVALSVHQVNLHRQQLRYQPVEELVLGITSDLDRCLSRALSIATQVFNETGDETKARESAYDFISMWVQSIIVSYSHLSIKMNVNRTGVGLTDVDLDIDWVNKVGSSRVSCKFNLDIDAYGFKGWVGNAGKSVRLEIYNESIKSNPTDNPPSSTLKFNIIDNMKPLQSLTRNDLIIYVRGPGQVDLANITDLVYLGGGNYSVTFNPKVDDYNPWIKLYVLTPEDRIWVSAIYAIQSSGSWGTLYLRKQTTNPQNITDKYELFPELPDKEGKISSFFSTGQDKQGLNVSSPPAPFDLYIARYVNVTVYVRPNPSWNAKDMTVELGFTYNSTYYSLGNRTFDGPTEGLYKFTIDTWNVTTWPLGQQVIPTGSIITLTVIMTFREEPWGTFFLYYGSVPPKCSYIELF